MIAETGQLALALALALALVQAVLPLAGAARGDRRWMAAGHWMAWGVLLFLATAYACLTTAFVQYDFSVAYVAQHANLALPLHYRVTAVWGGHEGSLLLWVLILALWTVAVSHFSRSLPRTMVARIIAVLGAVTVGFLAFMIFTSNPFDRLIPAPLDGRDLNPLLQDPGMIFHPPLLYMGYVGFSVTFAFAIAALLNGRLDAAWARWSRPWAAVAWAFLTLGIALGSWWAYYELGWGGWWFWDPVENASLMPWLTGTALIHSLAVTDKRGGFRVWTLMLAIVTFGLTLLGAFLVRSGVITSVHAFATDPERGTFILAFLVLSMGLALALYTWRAPRVGPGPAFGYLSRESGLLANNLLLAVATLTVLLGTLYPLAMDALGGGRISVGPPYFEAVFTPVMLPLLVLMGLGPLLRWKLHAPGELARAIAGIVVAAGVIGGLWPLALGAWSPLTALSTVIASFILLAIALDLHGRLRPATPGWIGLRRRLKGLKPHYLGMHLAHAGVAVFLIGVAMVSTYEVERDVRLAPGDEVTVAGYTFTFLGTHERVGSNFLADTGRVTVTRDGQAIARLHPEKRHYPSQSMPMTQAALDRGLFRDLYVSLGDPLDDGAWVVRVYYKPYMTWLWGGCLFLTLGALLAATDRRYRLVRAPRTRPARPAGALRPGEASC
ncbi:heme lyase CcmF/NrfE family subunit [Alkalilimnicola ehrlichii MLHE-1]|uniref:Cytochrome c-type biogenesis protein CcmF n=1 Tax=Alkalilimnicola ehrlichii (strain ATCC BAA-1101 / DSM 17681 / MLHE-1) TaxID=187272 RepID=Q0A804_ALKEH|nr:heme lyase CcmF/NrfE family subunit [Alkalilimnicola ehrlichii]ABI57033.1 cytochrome c-type biogenesis protein CcmF [Alkalilimnicola ehrlichii MLHE-1]